jgi:cyclopropane fatty-acyl-phospholipid synthase-like methyltransferase
LHVPSRHFSPGQKRIRPRINRQGGFWNKRKIDMEQFWNERYVQANLAYGQQPNVFLKEHLAGLPPGKILFPAEGEGRNAVYAARQGWDVVAFDFSEAGRDKAQRMAAGAGVAISYQVQNAVDFWVEADSLDAVALIYAHFPVATRKAFHANLQAWLKPNGVVMLEAFHPRQLQYSSGGPKQESMLYSPGMLLEDFKDLEIFLLEELEIVLDEGRYHQGPGFVTRLVARKPASSVNEFH